MFTGAFQHECRTKIFLLIKDIFRHFLNLHALQFKKICITIGMVFKEHVKGSSRICPYLEFSLLQLFFTKNSLVTYWTMNMLLICNRAKIVTAPVEVFFLYTSPGKRKSITMITGIYLLVPTEPNSVWSCMRSCHWLHAKYTRFIHWNVACFEISNNLFHF